MADATAGRGEAGSAAVDFVLTMLLVVPLVLGIAQVALVLHVRNVVTSSASEGARVAARSGAAPADGAARARELIARSVGARYADDVSVHRGSTAAGDVIVVEVAAEVPALGLFGPAVPLRVRAHAVAEPPP